MKQILQNLGTGETILADVPCPNIRSGHLLIQTQCSLISLGTERMLIDFGKANLLDKARQQPDKVKMVLQKVKTDGLLPTIDSIRSKLDQPLPLGYCNAGVVIEVGDGVKGFKVGDRVVSNGPHADIVCVPENLCAKIPEQLSFDAAVYTVIGSIGLQGIRLIAPTLGESVVVTGLGLIGLLCVQLLRAHGCRVLGVDFDSAKCSLARQYGAETVDLSKGEDPVSAGLAFSGGRGMDAVVITAATKSNEPVRQAALMCRKRGRIVLVGVVGLELSRADFYEKELSFQVSCSYGPGRYDPEYEIKGHDYPFGLVRWTEKRNFEALLQLMVDKRIETASLTTDRFPFAEATGAYAGISKGAVLGVLLDYPKVEGASNQLLRQSTLKLTDSVTRSSAEVVVGVIGAGNFAGQVLIPALRKTGVRLKSIASGTGVTGTHNGKKYGFELSTTDVNSILGDDEINAVVISTQHDSHATLVCQALVTGKNVFVEKPLCLNEAELVQIENCLQSAPGEPLLMVGFNRRFAPHAVKMKSLLAAVKEPKVFIMTVNAGMIPANHWVHDPVAGGGRIIGEGCHFIDLLRFLSGSRITGLQAMQIGDAPGVVVRDDKMTITLRFADGSVGTVHYLANGSKSFPKERLEVFCAGRVLQLDNFKKLTGYGWPGFTSMNLWQQDKGHNAELAAFVDAIRFGKPAPISFAELVEVTQASFAAMQAANDHAEEQCSPCCE